MVAAGAVLLGARCDYHPLSVSAIFLTAAGLPSGGAGPGGGVGSSL